MKHFCYLFKIEPKTESAQEILLANLSLLPFDSFIENSDYSLTAYSQTFIDKKELKTIPIWQNQNYKISYEIEEIADENWNSTWEKNFQPILIKKDCYVRAPFHEPMKNVTYDLIIEPKMSFGTGHHATTSLMLSFLLETNLKGKTILDMGCGTGILGILAKKKGAKTIHSLDIDSWAYENTIENAKRNQVDLFVKQAGAEAIEEIKPNDGFDIILANINRNVLIEDMDYYLKSLKKNGTIYLSGFYEEDITQIINKNNKLSLKESKIENNWVALRLKYDA